MKFKRNTGITLIALVVTIIVLLILAGVTLSLALNSNGVFQRSKNAAAAYKNAEEAEKAELDKVSEEMDKLLGENGHSEESKVSWALSDDKDNDGKVSVGDAVKTDENEEFFVIKADDSTVTLLSKYNLATSKKDGKYYQQTSKFNETACAFSNTFYWTTGNINTDPGTYEEGDAMEKAVTYGNQNGGKGRLLTSSEAETLKSSMNEAFSPSETIEDPFNLTPENPQFITQYLYYYLADVCAPDHETAPGYVGMVGDPLHDIWEYESDIYLRNGVLSL